MEEQAEKILNKAIPKEPMICEECKSNPSKYKCPSCFVRSCSLPCVKAHKQRTGCSGKRNQTQFVPLSQFDDNLLLSDYNLLEEVKRVAESAQRMRNKLCGYPHFKLPYHLQGLRSAAGSRRTKLLFLPSGMSKREKNQTRYDRRKKSISWTIEWHFHSTDMVLHDHGVSENTSFYSILEKHLKPGPWNHQLKKFCEEQLDSLKLFIRKYPKGPNLQFKALDIKSPIRQELANVVILEFPVIYVLLPSHSINFEVVKDVNSSIHKPQKEDCEGNRSPEGVSFREEEIEENSSWEPQVLDLMKQVDSSSSHQMHSQNKISEQALNNSLDRPQFKGNTVRNLVRSPPKIKEVESPKNMVIEFDQDLIDVYADLMAEINPDDFLDFESEFGKGREVGEESDICGHMGISPVPEELEEGEIAE